jgi:lipopolysaccharide export system permease protein
LIIFRYFTKEVICTTLAVTSSVIFIFICNQLVRYLGGIAHGKYAADMLFRLVSLQVPFLFGLLLPMGLFFGLLLIYSRLYADSEMTVLMTSGMSRKQLLGMTMIISMIVCVIVSVLVLTINPVISNKRYNLVNLAKVKTAFQMITPGRFQSSMDGKKVFYTRKLSDDDEKMEDVFVAQQVDTRSDTIGVADARSWIVFSALDGHQEVDEKTGDRFMVMNDGYRYEGIPGQKDFQVVKYKNCKMRLRVPSLLKRDKKVKELTTRELLQGAQDENYMAELQWRLSMPISVIILSFLAIPLSRVRPKEGRFNQFLPAILVYIVYVNLLFLARYWLEDGMTPPWLGLWWVHMIILGTAIVLWRRDRNF